MKIVVISDTHGKHGQLVLPKGDMIIHAGDVSSKGTVAEIQIFLDWFSVLDFKYKVFIAGNHDFFFEKNSIEVIEKMIPENVTYLNDSSVEIEGIKLWGSPISPWFYDWAFNRKRGKEIKKHWGLIDDNVDILITHGPPYRVLDKTISGEFVGCKELKKTVNRIKPSYHIFGHIHESYGSIMKNETTFINASNLNFNYQLVNLPIILNLTK